ncbi:unnamed protein product (macronuclear) [Paramecium tetraurelia]|uniref:Uncharacterized protein n=1 Tax=Paramecium tetraurelia TaxID=5888 RepID=A0BTW2_PARTE|nr:uncharacterized protein GSPATT00032211001 [Paramecium tetraurelia]CAK61979.1 unnamed protein product [Paramecium tetraurelia]|eukprot:XP_001429377.1 hypothetical protein (macronuclear) [Paramecium tetraurelia strain d4-2]
MNYYNKKIAVKNDEHTSLPQIYNHRSLSLNKEIISSKDVNHKKYFSFVHLNQKSQDRYQQKPQHMRNMQRKNQMLKLQLKRVSKQIKKVSPPRLQYETLEEIYFIRYKKMT